MYLLKESWKNEGNKWILHKMIKQLSRSLRVPAAKDIEIK